MTLASPPLHETGTFPPNRSVLLSYTEVETGMAFPDLPMDRINEFLSIGLASGQSAAVRAMRNWLGGRRAGTRGSGPV